MYTYIIIDKLFTTNDLTLNGSKALYHLSSSHYKHWNPSVKLMFFFNLQLQNTIVYNNN